MICTVKLKFFTSDQSEVLAKKIFISIAVVNIAVYISIENCCLRFNSYYKYWLWTRAVSTAPSFPITMKIYQKIVYIHIFKITNINTNKLI